MMIIDLTNSVVRLLLNLSFDSDHRAAMVKAGMLPKLVNLVSDHLNEKNRLKYEVLFMDFYFCFRCQMSGYKIQFAVFFTI